MVKVAIVEDIEDQAYALARALTSRSFMDRRGNEIRLSLDNIEPWIIGSLEDYLTVLRKAESSDIDLLVADLNLMPSGPESVERWLNAAREYAEREGFRDEGDGPRVWDWKNPLHYEFLPGLAIVGAFCKSASSGRRWVCVASKSAFDVKPWLETLDAEWMITGPLRTAMVTEGDVRSFLGRFFQRDWTSALWEGSEEWLDASSKAMPHDPPPVGLRADVVERTRSFLKSLFGFAPPREWMDDEQSFYSLYKCLPGLTGKRSYANGDDPCYNLCFGNLPILMGIALGSRGIQPVEARSLLSSVVWPKEPPRGWFLPKQRRETARSCICKLTEQVFGELVVHRVDRQKMIVSRIEIDDERFLMELNFDCRTNLDHRRSLLMRLGEGEFAPVRILTGPCCLQDAPGEWPGYFPRFVTQIGPSAEELSRTTVEFRGLSR